MNAENQQERAGGESRWQRWSKRMGGAVCLMGLLAGTPACSDDPHESGQQEDDGPYRVMVISDLHLFDMDRIGHEGEAWEKRLAIEDKNYTYCAAIMEELTRRVKEQQVRYVVVPGDLTKDGEVINHEFAAACFKAMEEAGAQVFVINGNHDLSNAAAKTFTPEGEFPIETATSADFLRIYHDYGYDHALSQEAGGLSYSADLGKDIRLILMDSNIYNDSKTAPRQETKGTLKASTLEWAKAQCAEALKAGRVPVGVLHHGLVEHIPGIQSVWLPEYLADNYVEAREALAAAGMHIVLTGHQHMQDIASVDVQGAPFYDIQTGSIVSLAPLRYLDVHPETRTLQISSSVVSQLPGGVDVSAVLEKTCSEGTHYYFIALLTQFVQSQGLTEERIENVLKGFTQYPIVEGYSIIDAMTSAFLIARKGDEQQETHTQAVCEVLQSYVEAFSKVEGYEKTVQLFQMAERLYAGFYVDSPSADNSLEIAY